MALSIVRQPGEFKYGDDFDLFFDRFSAYLVNVKCSQYDLFVSFLDSVSFRKCTAIVFDDTDHKTDAKVDLVKARPVLKGALSKHEDVPPNIAIRFRNQKNDESIGDFGYAMQVLGHKAFDAGAETNAQVIEAFCMNLSDCNLTAKMIQKTFTTLKAAIDYAVSKESTSNIQKYVRNSRSLSTDPHSHRDVGVLECITEGVHNVSVAEPMTRSRPNRRSNNINSEQPHQYQGRTNRADPNVPAGDSGTHHDTQVRHGNGGHDSGNSGNSANWDGRQRQNTSGNWRGNGRRQFKETRACHYCKIKGHIIRNCYKRQRDQSQSSYNAPGRGGHYQQYDHGNGGGAMGYNSQGYNAPGRGGHNQQYNHGNGGEAVGYSGQDFQQRPAQ
jgi:hypothetical protein